MSTLWIDTDYGFDDLWAIILLRHWAVQIAGISLVAGNAPLPQVISNAVGAREAYSLNALLYAGAEKPLKRELETAERFLGPKGMQSRGQYLPEVRLDQALPDAIDGLTTWLLSASENERRDILAIGPLTNLAQLLSDTPETCEKITRLIWMGGSNGVGNHSAQAEFNALADPEAAMIVAQANLPLDCKEGCGNNVRSFAIICLSLSRFWSPKSKKKLKLPAKCLKIFSRSLSTNYFDILFHQIKFFTLV